MRLDSTSAQNLTATNRVSTTMVAMKNVTTVLLSMLLLMTSLSTTAQKLSPSDAAKSARHITGGKILKVKSPDSGSQDYRVKILSPKGQVRSIVIDGNSGKLKKRRKQKRTK